MKKRNLQIHRHRHQMRKHGFVQQAIKILRLRPHSESLLHFPVSIQTADARAVAPADEVVKVGDTLADIREGVNAKVWSVGIISGSNEMCLTEEEHNRMPTPSVPEPSEMSIPAIWRLCRKQSERSETARLAKIRIFFSAA